MRSSRDAGPTLSVVLAVRDAEEVAGREVRRIADHLRGRGVSFEIVAINDGCCDNSLALLRLLAAELPELRLDVADARGRAYLRGASEARGEVIALAQLGSGAVPLPALGWALARLRAGRHAVVFRGRCIVARRLECLAALVGGRGRGELFEWTFERAAAVRRLDLELVGTRRAPGLLAPVLRFLAA